ncbi:MAG: hypothetical protein DRP11_00335 [Candidatus Aenigmatarchaeota archaeon]|nr:MAG: hypothetical protein DRP11_00335 [Candidatus Aenigmarchaeota archaeon]
MKTEVLKRILIETDADKLLDLVNQKKRVTVEEAAKILSVEQDVVERWAKIFEEHHLVSLNYGLGDITIKKRIDSESEKTAKEIENILGKKFIESTERIDEDIEDIFLYIKNSMEGIKKKVDDIKSSIEELEKLSPGIRKGIKMRKVKKSIKRGLSELEDLRKELDEKSKVMKRYEKEIKELNESLLQFSKDLTQLEEKVKEGERKKSFFDFLFKKEKEPEKKPEKKTKRKHETKKKSKVKPRKKSAKKPKTKHRTKRRSARKKKVRK